jgi:NADH-quinone oxidoreductase subunit E
MSTSVDDLLKGHAGAGRDHLIPILQEIQEKEGFLSRENLERVARHLNISSAKVYGVASFYNQFRFNAPGRFNIQLCRGTACHVKGSLNLLQTLQTELKIRPGQTTKDGLFSLEVVACIGACGLAPVMCINGEFHAAVSQDQVSKILDTYRTRENSHE